MAKLPFEMPNLLNFPMGNLYYDLILEVIDELHQDDVLELMKVARRFRGILLQKPARIFGKQIHSIDIYREEHWEEEDVNWDEETYSIRVKKFRKSTPFCFYLLSRDVLLLQVERCSVFTIRQVGGHGEYLGDLEEKELSALKKIFANLKQVNKLSVWYLGNECNVCLENFKAEVTERASFQIGDGEEEVKQQLLLLSGSLQNCKKIQMDNLHGLDLYPTVYSALSKTQTEFFMTRIWAQEVESTIGLILNSGIPSKNEEAACFVQFSQTNFEMNNWIKSFPEIRHVNKRDQTFIRNTMKESLRKHVNNYEFGELDGKKHYYRKRFDEIGKDCIYVVGNYFFWAKYVSLMQGPFI